MRTAIERDLHVGPPVVTDIYRLENVPRDLIELTDRIRAENGDLEERVIRRKVRDTLDVARAKRGPVTIGGIGEIEKSILGEIKRQIEEPTG